MAEKITAQVSDYGLVWILVDGKNEMCLGRQSGLTNEVAARINSAEKLAEACDRALKWFGSQETLPDEFRDPVFCNLFDALAAYRAREA